MNALGGGSNANGGQSGSNCSAAFCEDFESGKFDAGRWTVAIQGSNTASVQSAKSAHGKYAAQFHYSGTRGTWAMALAKGLRTSLATHHFGRASVLFQAALANRHAGLVTAGTSGFPTYKCVLAKSFDVFLANLPAARGAERRHEVPNLPAPGRNGDGRE